MLYCCDDTLLQQPVMFLQFAGICILIFNVRNMKRAEKVVFRIGTVVFRLFANCSVVRILLSIDEKTFFLHILIILISRKLINACHGC